MPRCNSATSAAAGSRRASARSRDTWPKRSSTTANAGDPSNPKLWTNPVYTGICYYQSETEAANVSDGMSNTYFAGEKSLDPFRYADGLSGGDDDHQYTGVNVDTLRTTSLYWSLSQDRQGYESYGPFGSAHSGGFNMVFCEGSSNYHIYNNLCLRGGIKNREGFYRVVENNIMVGTFHPHAWFKNSGDVFVRNIVFGPYRPAAWGSFLVDGVSKPAGKQIDNNLLHDPKQSGPASRVPKAAKIS